jgi:hypothetical protein
MVVLQQRSIQLNCTRETAEVWQDRLVKSHYDCRVVPLQLPNGFVHQSSKYRYGYAARQTHKRPTSLAQPVSHLLVSAQGLHARN